MFCARYVAEFVVEGMNVSDWILCMDLHCRRLIVRKQISLTLSKLTMIICMPGLAITC